MRTWTVPELGGADRVMRFTLPAGIGDISWCYSKLRHLPALLGRPPLLLSIPDEEPKRGGDFISLLPDARWGGYEEGGNSWRVLSQSLPAIWPVSMGTGPFLPRGYSVNVAANMHLECGRTLASWLPELPCDYHYPLNIPATDMAAGDTLLAGLPRPLIAVYVSNREKDAIKAGGWSLWSAYQWTDFLASVMRLPECAGGSLIFLGADWDRDKTASVAGEMERGHTVRRVIGQPLGVALRVLSRANYAFAFPSGIGILANVLRTPGLMMLPWILRGLETAYADPFDLATNRYRAWADPSPEEAYRWFANVSMPQVLAESAGKWAER